MLTFLEAEVIVTENLEDLKTLIKLLLKEAERVCLKSNGTKPKYMHFTRYHNHREGHLKIYGHEFD